MNTSAKSDGRLTIITEGNIITFVVSGKEEFTVTFPDEVSKENYMKEVNKLLTEYGVSEISKEGTSPHIQDEDGYRAKFNREARWDHALVGFKDPTKLLILDKKSNQTKISGIS